MNKAFKNYGLIWAIAFVVFNVICFVIPGDVLGMDKFGGAFWSGYVFISLAFVGQLACAYLAFQGDTVQKMFYNIPLISISYTGLIIMLVAGGAVMLIPDLPNWVGIIVCLLVLAFTAMAVIKAKFAAEVVGQIDEKIKAQTFFIKSLTVDVDCLAAKAKSPEAKAECEKLYEAVRYSDPMSNAALADIEGQITIKFAAFSQGVDADDIKTIKERGAELAILINERNKKCKLLKH